MVFIFVSCKKKGYYGVVSVGLLSFDCRSHYFRRPQKLSQHSDWFIYFIYYNLMAKITWKIQAIKE